MRSEAATPAEYQERMNWGMIAYEVPLVVFPDTYNGQPLIYAALASHLVSTYMEKGSAAEFQTEYQATGKRYEWTNFASIPKARGLSAGAHRSGHR